ncbi:MAG: TIGR00266 family protein [Desulfobacteraceae bacterium 4572_35.1]|nr:MAG: TIGR00266 family protein [Desulfobacteraceae bacterium 4572_35.1]
MAQWYLNYNGEQSGPFDEAQAQQIARNNINGLAWREGFSSWLPIEQITELAGTSDGIKPPELRPLQQGCTRADEIDFKIFGTEMQFVEIELDPSESAIAEAGAMMYKDQSISMETIFGDGSEASNGSGFMGKLLGAGKRLITGESLFTTVFTHNGTDKAHVAFGAPYPGNIIPISLEALGGEIICQKDAFLCAAKGVSIGIHFQKKILTGLFGGEGFIMQKLEGDGMTFLHAGGSIIERELNPGEELHVDTGCIVAYEPQVDFNLQQAGGIKTSLFGGEGLFFAQLRGPGKIWLQSLPFSRLAGRMLQAAPQRGGSKGEGSILGSLGNLIDGDNF